MPTKIPLEYIRSVSSGENPNNTLTSIATKPSAIQINLLLFLKKYLLFTLTVLELFRYL